MALIAGPTASGKSALAVALARAVGGVVINADASQVYADLAVLSARPGPADMAAADHRLFGYRDGASACSAADWADDARAAINAAAGAGRISILVGGTGLYLRTLLDGIAPVPPIDPAIRAAVRALPVAEAHAALVMEDPASAARLQPADSSRIARALEVVRATGRTLQDWQKERVGGIGAAIRLTAAVVLPPRDWLNQRIAARAVAMIEGGAIEEVQALLDRGLDPALPVMRAIGVPEITAFLAGEIDRATMTARLTTATQRYAKRQRTWFRHQPSPGWERYPEHIDNRMIDDIVTIMRDQLLT